jgi:hypothetical protein
MRAQALSIQSWGEEKGRKSLATGPVEMLEEPWQRYRSLLNSPSRWAMQLD